MSEKEVSNEQQQHHQSDELADALDDLFNGVSTMIKSELQVDVSALFFFPINVI